MRNTQVTPERKKAKELIDRFWTYASMWGGGIKVQNENMKQCALITVDEVLKILIEVDENFTNYVSEITFWGKVRKELENYKL